MKCPVCKASLRANAIFCDTCGGKIENQNVAATLTLPRSQANLKSPATKTAAPSNNNIPILLSGAALVIVGAWLGATFLTAEPKPVPREPGEAPKQVPLVIQNPTPLPAQPASAPVAPEPKKPTAQKTDPDGTLNPFAKKKKEPAPTLAADPFASPNRNADPDSAVNPFAKKKTTPKPDDDLTIDPFGDSVMKKSPDATLKPNFR